MHNKKLILANFFMHRMSFSFIMYLFVYHFNYVNFVRLIALGKVVFFPPTYLVHCISTYTMQPSPSHHTTLDKVLLAQVPSSICLLSCQETRWQRNYWAKTHLIAASVAARVEQVKTVSTRVSTAQTEASTVRVNIDIARSHPERRTICQYT